MTVPAGLRARRFFVRRVFHRRRRPPAAGFCTVSTEFSTVSTVENPSTQRKTPAKVYAA